MPQAESNTKNNAPSWPWKTGPLQARGPAPTCSGNVHPPANVAPVKFSAQGLLLALF